ncbi:MAG: stage III sporulation protein AB [Oscillospiraceae bacterium]|nr:stage III sporulation protein AB [Oscillospiraceae bacterium]
MAWIIKLLCVCGAMGAAALLGFSESWKLKLRVRELEDLLRFFQAMEEEIRYTARPIRWILSQHQTELPFLAQCEERMQTGASFAESWQWAVEHTLIHSGLTSEDRRYLLEFGTSFGILDQEGQLSSCQMTICRLTHQLEQSRQQVAQKGRLYGSLGILCGAGILLMVV